MKPARFKNGLKGYWLHLACFFAGLIMTAGILCFSSSPEVVVFDKGQAVSAFATELQRKKVDDHRAQRLTKEFIQAIDDALLKASINHHWIIVPKTSVYTGAKDMTGILMSQIAKTMKKSKRGPA